VRMGALGQRVVQRILRSKVLPLLTVLVLFSGLVSISGYLLWEARIRQEISVVGEWMVQGVDRAARQGHLSTEPKVLRIHGGEDVSFLAGGDMLQLKMAVGPDRTELVAARVVRLDARGPFTEMVLSPEAVAEESYVGKLLKGRMGKTGPMRMTLVVRKQRLLTVALQRGKADR